MTCHNIKLLTCCNYDEDNCYDFLLLSFIIFLAPSYFNRNKRRLLAMVCLRRPPDAPVHRYESMVSDNKRGMR